MLAGEVDSSWNAATNRWKASSRTLYTNDQSGLPVETVEQRWDTTATIPAWKNRMKMIITNSTLSTSIVNPLSKTQTTLLQVVSFKIAGSTVRVPEQLAAQTASATVYDIAGKQVARVRYQQGEGNQLGSDRTLAPGRYVVKLYGKTGTAIFSAPLICN